MNGYECFVRFRALKAHFSTSYDFFRYNGKISSATSPAYEASPDKISFEKVAKMKDPEEFLLSGVLESENAYIGAMVREKFVHDYHTRRIGRLQGLTYTVVNELRLVSDDFEKMMDAREGHPLLLRAYLGGIVSLETLAIVVKLTNAIPKWSKALPYDPVWDAVQHKITKYLPFLQLDEDKLRLAIRRAYS